MDDTAQSPAQPGQQTVSQPPVSQQAAQQPVVPQQSGGTVQDAQVVQEPQQSVQQSTPVQEPAVQAPQPVSVPTTGKENEGTLVTEMQPTQPEVNIPQEVQETGVEATPSEEPQLTEEHKEAGIEAVKEATPVPSGPTIVQLPEDYKAPKGFFSFLHQKVKNAATWLYLLLFKAQQQAAQEKKKV